MTEFIDRADIDFQCMAIIVYPAVSAQSKFTHCFIISNNVMALLNTVNNNTYMCIALVIVLKLILIKLGHALLGVKVHLYNHTVSVATVSVSS